MPKSKKQAELEQKADENLAGWQRAQADLENLKKRTVVEKEEYRRFCLEDFILQLLPVLDNFKLATAHIPDEQKDVGWIVGLIHIQKQLSDIIAGYGVETVEINKGNEFDPNLADAIESVKSSEIESGHIVRIVQSGYRMAGKVVRHAKVVVSR